MKLLLILLFSLPSLSHADGDDPWPKGELSAGIELSGGISTKILEGEFGGVQKGPFRIGKLHLEGGFRGDGSPMLKVRATGINYAKMPKARSFGDFIRIGGNGLRMEWSKDEDLGDGGTFTAYAGGFQTDLATSKWGSNETGLSAVLSFAVETLGIGFHGDTEGNRSTTFEPLHVDASGGFLFEITPDVTASLGLHTEARVGGRDQAELGWEAFLQFWEEIELRFRSGLVGLAAHPLSGGDVQRAHEYQRVTFRMLF